MPRPIRNPRGEALRYRIWCWCQANGWEHTREQIADALNAQDSTRRVTVQQVSGVVMTTAWANRLRVANVHPKERNARTAWWLTTDRQSVIEVEGLRREHTRAGMAE